MGAQVEKDQNFCAKGSMPEFLTCTQKLQEWNKPHARKANPIAVEDIRSHQQATVDMPRKSVRIPSNFDPRPVGYRQPDPEI